jgi:hypothetical protein
VSPEALTAAGLPRREVPPRLPPLGSLVHEDRNWTHPSPSRLRVWLAGSGYLAVIDGPPSASIPQASLHRARSAVKARFPGPLTVIWREPELVVVDGNPPVLLWSEGRVRARHPHVRAWWEAYAPRLLA